jgi:hypothetical protein
LPCRVACASCALCRRLGRLLLLLLVLVLLQRFLAFVLLNKSPHVVYVTLQLFFEHQTRPPLLVLIDLRMRVGRSMTRLHQLPELRLGIC